MPLSKEIKSRIQKEAKEYSSSANVNLAYKTGAKSEAERAQGLVEALEKVKRMCLATGPEAELRDRVINDILDTAGMELIKYNNPK